MEDLLRRSYPYPYPCEPSPTSSSPLSRYSDSSIKFGQSGTCIDYDAPAVIIFDAFSTIRLQDYGLLGTASLGQVLQLEQIAEGASSPAVRRCS
jgi:hypothetical protein